MQQQQQNHHQQQQQQLYERLDTTHVLKPPQPPKKRSFLPIFDEQNLEFGQKMQQEKPSSSRLGAKPTGGVIVEVQGGHIVRSTGRKDRHSKVCTAKGPRDRRVRLSAHTAIQFYDVQDRLGYDRPSKAVDWLIKKAKASIDGLAELPAWTPSTGCIQTNTLAAEISNNEILHQQQQQNHHHQQEQEQEQIHGACNNVNTRDDNRGFLPPSLDSDAIADTIKSFFPVDAAANNGSVDVSSSASNAMQHFQNYSNQDLRLSLQSFQDPMLIHQQHHGSHNHQGGDEHSGFFSGSNPLGFDPHSAGWAEQHQPAEIGRFQRMIAWNSGNNTGHDGGGGGGYLFDTPQSPPHQHNQQPFLQQLFGQQQQSQYYSQQRGPLQSSNTSSIRAWIDSPMTTDQAIGSGYDFSGFRIPARIQGEEEHEDGNYHHNKLPSSASSDSRH